MIKTTASVSPNLHRVSERRHNANPIELLRGYCERVDLMGVLSFQPVRIVKLLWEPSDGIASALDLAVSESPSRPGTLSREEVPVENALFVDDLHVLVHGMSPLEHLDVEDRLRHIVAGILRAHTIRAQEVQDPLKESPDHNVGLGVPYMQRNHLLDRVVTAIKFLEGV